MYTESFTYPGKWCFRKAAILQLANTVFSQNTPLHQISHARQSSKSKELKKNVIQFIEAVKYTC
jgi:hypothetical protein